MTTPFTTVATVASLELQITVLFVALAGSITAFSVSPASPSVKLSDVLFKVTPVTRTSPTSFTCTLKVYKLLIVPSFTVTVITLFP
ncbi:hypothetical protein D3C78_1093440 [compost metagenome]